MAGVKRGKKGNRGNGPRESEGARESDGGVLVP